MQRPGKVVFAAGVCSRRQLGWMNEWINPVILMTAMILPPGTLPGTRSNVHKNMY